MNKKPLNKNRAWYTLKDQAGQPAELLIYDVIGDWAGVSARQLVSTLKDIDADEITVRINSPGGSVFDGVAIYNALRYHKAHIHVRIEGLAASIASVIAMAGDSIHMAENALLMIHNPFGWVGGDAGELRKMADMLDKTTEVIAQTYCSRCELDLEAMFKLMNDETWFTATEAEGHGLIDKVDSPVKMAASFDLSSFMHPPHQPDPEPKEEKGLQALAVMTLCNQAGYPEMAEQFVRQQQGLEDVKARLAECEAIKSLCTAAHCPDRASQYIRSGKSKEQVRTELFDLLVQDDDGIDNSLTPHQQEQTFKPLIDTQSVYRKRNGQTDIHHPELGINFLVR
ncbi:head maturation protease, ClpP-related [Endozoicomonas numazuensis]|uniref:head maturation protease, ClpP-related n=1 Tax=Endozoicomonas numazuensis TaxID=1137799 RepID=UPI00068B900C|nr:head maturation protease, ClpP-related [Endozoicomonas numazuensis]